MIPDNTTIENGYASLHFDPRHGGVLGMFESKVLWSLQFEDRKTLTNLDAPPPAFRKVGPEVLQITWLWEERRIEAQIRLEGSFARWRIQTWNCPGLIQVDYPVLGVGGAPDALYLPWQWGVKIPRPLEALAGDQLPEQYVWLGHERKRHVFAAEYPGMFSMQYLLLEYSQRCFYFAAHDGKANYKRFGLYGNGDSPAMMMRNYPDNPGDYAMEYDVVTGFAKGNWEQASLVYRQWAHQQTWCARGRIAERADIPSRIKNTHLWCWNWNDWENQGGPEKLLPVLQELKRQTGMTPGLHWYGWNNQRSDTDYPEYRLDEKATVRLRQALENFHSEGIVVIAYLNGRLWNIDTPSWQERKAGRYACRLAATEEGEPFRYYLESYMDRPFAVMCPATAFWRDTLRDKVEELLNLKLDGVYLDQITSACAIVCKADDHGHLLHGNYYSEGYRTLMKELRENLRKDHPEAFFSSESVTECYLGDFDLLLGYQAACSPEAAFGPEARSVPFFSMIYHGFVPLYGTGTSVDQKTQFFHGQSLDLSGGILPSLQGYYAADLGKYPEELAFFKERCRVFEENAEFLGNADRQPTPAYQCSQVAVVEGGAARMFPAVEISCWEYQEKRALLIVNHTARPQEIHFPDGTNQLVASYSITLQY
ncbi:MAG: DUF6259 domain-containing protein [Victivallaceae bacterium]|nr:DUF6259 domain-containing protein [Victivallaceae bacterium]